MARLSLALPTIIDSDTKTSLDLAMEIASSMVDAYCKISRVTIEIGVLATKGILDFPAFIVTVSLLTMTHTPYNSIFHLREVN